MAATRAVKADVRLCHSSAIVFSMTDAKSRIGPSGIFFRLGDGPNPRFGELNIVLSFVSFKNFEAGDGQVVCKQVRGYQVLERFATCTKDM